MSETSNSCWKKLCQEEDIDNRKEKKGFFQSFTQKADIFSYIPVPQTFPVSTKKSRFGSILVLIIFFAYMLYDFVQFITNNPPSLNVYPLPLPSTNFQVPEIALGFIYGTALDQTLTDSTYFTIAADQAYTQLGQPTTHTPQTLIENCSPSWLGNLTNIYQNLTCINNTYFNLSGVPFGSPQTYYPRFQILLCNNKSGNCCTQAQLQNMTSGGRLFMFIKKSPSINFATGNLIDDPYSFQFSTYFMVPYLYNRVNVVLQPNIYTIYPNLFTTYTTKIYSQLQVLSQDFQNSNVSVYNTMDMFSISIVLSPKILQTQVHYTTIMTHISLWGAMWGVLFSIFAIVFLAYNRNRFLNRNPDWNEFDKKVSVIETNLQTKGTTKQTELQDISSIRKQLVPD